MSRVPEPAPRRLIPAVFIWALAAAACSEGAPRYLSLDRLPHDQLFVLELDSQGRPSKVAGQLRVADVESARLEISTSAQRVAIVGLDLSSLEPLHDRASSRPLSLRLADAEPCEVPGFPGRVDAGTGTLLRRLPPAARIHRFDVSTNSLTPADTDLEQGIRTGVQLEVPLDAEGCAGRSPEERVLEPFADRSRPIPDGTMLEGEALTPLQLQFSNVAATDDDRALVTAAKYVFLFERSRAWEARTTRARLMPGAAQLEVVALDPVVGRGAPAGAQRVLVGGSVLRGPGLGREGRIWTLSLDAEGLGEVSTASASQAVVHDIYIEPDSGRVIASAEGGHVLIQDRPGEAFRGQKVQADPTGANNPCYIAATGRPDRPYATSGASDGSMYLSNADTSEWDLVTDGLDITRTYKAIGAVETGEGRDLWTVSTSGDVFRLGINSSSWARLAIAMPLSYACGPSTVCGWHEHQNRGLSLGTVRRSGHSFVYVSGTDCFAVAEIRDDRACASYLFAPDPADPSRPLQVPVGPDQNGEFKPRPMTALEVKDGWLLVASELGGVYQKWVGEGAPPQSSR